MTLNKLLNQISPYEMIGIRFADGTGYYYGAAGAFYELRGRAFQNKNIKQTFKEHTVISPGIYTIIVLDDTKGD